MALGRMYPEDETLVLWKFRPRAAEIAIGAL